ncbi:putative membrane protein [Halalkaliarchaeum sp. AArc-CO]|uniref:DUF7521 family protein n=1 Tax=unclassified Halalkaliarchaeum TaxID=2678344 RepID=UPI00217EE796|nr:MULTISPECIES: hypothetical protein [unclassified Halalkaliarchaeum]MDR5671915.1 hypothetical protein [Halalkaliarchaeum sp. AArc-GB]UWG51419.1 putative membrane protein [Halalkaliarchaeum sp. AArc-CO]
MESILWDVILVVSQTAIVVLGGSISYFAYKAYNRTANPALRALSIGFAIVTIGAVSAGVLHHLFKVELEAGIAINSILTAIGFAVVTYSLYVE